MWSSPISQRPWTWCGGCGARAPDTSNNNKKPSGTRRESEGLAEEVTGILEDAPDLFDFDEWFLTEDFLNRSTYELEGGLQ